MLSSRTVHLSADTGRVVALVLEGRLLAADVGALRERLNELSANGTRRALLDVSRLTYLCVSGLAGLLRDVTKNGQTGTAKSCSDTHTMAIALVGLSAHDLAACEQLGLASCCHLVPARDGATLAELAEATELAPAASTPAETPSTTS